ncbi:uncharacterized protein K444DRAFT_169897 [Hyaloscypha bicolor E]|uniref:Uncharacterized protein n=1 Tax=Hyaloscypha bicolor E TaxID=1095630 RepID=A0A2J6SRK5_9HELO|nr:uncharacterized protein K444DRAFT_169897 [Hyaloscypha bicolor E]PMD53369.1 hypothetical protein K444DRAFT_169897 [Hyaloscypha bicolor E]
MKSQKPQTPYPYQENPERHVPNSVSKSVEIHQEVTTKLTESQARSSSYPSNSHPERKPSQVPKDTNKQTHTHTRGQQREGSWTERSAFRSQPRCSRTITNEFPDCSRVKWGNGVLTRCSTASEHAGRKTGSSARLRRFYGGELGEWDGLQFLDIVFGAEDYFSAL